MPNGEQVRNGKAYEYAIAKEYATFLAAQGISVSFVEDDAFNTAKGFYDGFSLEKQREFSLSARSSIRTLLKLESGFISPKNASEELKIRIASDSEGEDGDVRDVLFSRASSKWEVGISAKNNNDDAKHSRLSKTIDFGDKWLGYPVSQNYWNAITPIFDRLQVYKDADKDWNDVPDKSNTVYKPLLDAFKEEMMRLYRLHPDIPPKLVQYLIGRFPFYKVIKDDVAKMVVVKAFNLGGKLNKTVNHNKPAYKAKKINFPSRIIEFDYKDNSDNTLTMVLDGGWEIRFRIHSADTKVETSLKFAVQLGGIPSSLFTQYIFVE